MYAHLVTFTFGPGMGSTAEKLADQFAPLVKARKGFKNITFLSDETSGDYGYLVVYESLEDAKAAVAEMGPLLDEAFKDLIKAPLTRRLFEVYEPKA